MKISELFCMEDNGLSSKKGCDSMKVRAKQRLLLERATKGITIRELAELAAVPMGTISRAENGQSISVKSASKLSKRYFL